MTAAAPLAFPGSRVLAGWWQQLAPVRPQALWAGHLLLHNVEALARVARERRLDPIDTLALQALTLEGRRTVPAVAERLHLAPQVLRQVFRRLEGEGLARTNGGGEWHPTPLGRHALARGDYAGPGHERRKFYFVEKDRPGCPPHFLSLNDLACTPWHPADEWAFDVALLHACVRRPAEWKRQHGFPLDVEDIAPGVAERGGVGAAPGEAPSQGASPLAPAWQRVVVVRPERLAVVLVRVPAEGGGDCLLGLPFRPEGWVLQADSPAFCLGAEWREVFAELEVGPPPEAWRQAWRAWCQPRRLPSAEVEACALERDGHRLRVVPARRFIDRLRAARSDALRGEAWVLAGEGRVRPAALLELVEARE